MVKVYGKGPYSKSITDYIAIVTSESLWWYYPDNIPVQSHLSLESRNQWIDHWVERREWKKLVLPKSTFVALRICDTKDIYWIVKSAIERNKQMSVKDRGFGSMDKERQREIASSGGRAAWAMGRAHRWTSEEAREAGRKGGAASQKAKTSKKVGHEQSNLSKV